MHKTGFILAALFLAATPALAQSLPDPVQYVVTPEIPGPNTVVSIEVQGVGTFLGDADITWRKDGAVVQSGTGLRTYSFVTGPLGSITRIGIDVDSSGGGSFNREMVFRPSVVNLVWEANTSAPPLYQGKPLYSGGSPLKVVALPTIIVNGSRVSSQSLSYQWTRNGEPSPLNSGVGRNVFSFDGDQLQLQEVVDVDVYFGTSLVAQGGVVIPTAQPQVYLYERDSLRGILYDTAMPQSVNLNAQEITFVAQPYHFDRASYAGATLGYTWSINGEETSGPDSTHGILTLRQTGDGEGSATLDVEVQNNNQNMLVQAASRFLEIAFGKQLSGSLFGI